MKNTKYMLTGASFLLSILLLISTAVGVITDKEMIKSEAKIIQYKNDSNWITDSPQGKFISVIRGWAVGNATSGKLIGSRGKIAIISFNDILFSQLRLFPIRIEIAGFSNVKAIVFRLDQTISEGAFDFERDWVIAIIFRNLNN